MGSSLGRGWTLQVGLHRLGVGGGRWGVDGTGNAWASTCPIPHSSSELSQTTLGCSSQFLLLGQDWKPVSFLKEQDRGDFFKTSGSGISQTFIHSALKAHTYQAIVPDDGGMMGNGPCLHGG